MYAAISPRDHVVGLLQDEGAWVQILDRAGVPASTVSAERYISRHPDTLVVDVRDGRQAVELLAERSTRSMCLDLTLLLFDRDVSVQTRQELAMELDLLFQDNDHRNYVLDIVLCRPLSPTADVDGAVSAVQSAKLVRGVVASILDCQNIVRLVQQSWLLVMNTPLVQQSGAEHVYSLLCRHGVFRRLALEAANTGQLDKLNPTLATQPSLCAELGTAPRIIPLLVNELRKTLPVGETSVDECPVDSEVIDSESQEVEVAPRQHASVHAAYTATLSQIAKITDLYGQMKDPQANDILSELITEQRKYSGGELNLVKSLCNIATQVGARGRPEISLNCLTKALEFPNGIDSQLYLQIGTELRELGKFEEAVTCYERATQLDDGSLAEKLRLAKIRLRVARGNYEEALSDYLAIPQLQLRPSELAGLGTLYRKMGRPREAREAYHSCLQNDKEFHSAYAGLAELRKQTGKPHQAIAEYNSLIRRFDDLEIGSKKIYDLARSHLFRLTGQYDKSEQLLHELLITVPADREVHLQFAKLLALRGDVDRAEEHFDKAEGPSLADLGQLVFAAATKTFDSTVVCDRLARIQTSIKPEDKGLASCLEAYELITNSDFERAQQVVHHPAYVDRMVTDFANVLRFHALRRASSSFDYKSDYSLCRIAKRSDRSLRRVMHAIACDDYQEADKLESEFLLRLVA